MPECFARLKADPIREQVFNFLTTAIEPDLIKTDKDLSTLITVYTRGMLGIPLGVPLPLDIQFAPSKSITVVRRPQEEAEVGIDGAENSPVPGAV